MLLDAVNNILVVKRRQVTVTFVDVNVPVPLAAFFTVHTSTCLPCLP